MPGWLNNIRTDGQTQMGLLKVRMRLQGKLEGIFGFVELSGGAVNIPEFVGRVGVAGIKLQFFLESFDAWLRSSAEEVSCERASNVRPSR